MEQPEVDRGTRTDVAGRVSAIVTTRNSAAHLEECLRSLHEQTYGDVEVVVVDNASSDGTPRIAERHADLVLEFGPERSAQRNHGVERSSGEFVLIVDSDMVLSPRVVQECVEAMRRDGAVAAIIPETSVGEGFWAACRALERSCYVGDETVEAARFFTREAYLRHGGYDEELTGPEDWDLPARIRRSEPITRVEATIEHREGRLRLLALMRKKYYYGRGFGRYIARHPGLASRQLQVVRPAFLRHRRRLARHPRLTAGMLVMKAAEFAAGGAGLLAAQAERLAASRRR